MFVLKEFLFSLVLALCVLSLQVVGTNAGWIDSPERGKVGWYGYEVEKTEKEPEKAEKKAEKISKGEKIESKRPVRWPTAEELYHMKPSQAREYIKKASEEAIANPTEENVSRWVQYVHVAQVKASEFAGAWSWVMQQNPDLYRTAALYPSVPLGGKAFWRTVWQDIQKLLKKKKDEYAILFFYGLEDAFDEAMKKILKSFHEVHPEWIVKEINIRKHPSIAETLKISYTPQLWLLRRGEEKPYPLAAGPVSVTHLEKKIYHTILVLEGKKPPKHAPYYPFNKPEIVRNSGGVR